MDLVKWQENEAFLSAHLANAHDRVQDGADIGVLQPPVVCHLGHKQLQTTHALTRRVSFAVG